MQSKNYLADRVLWKLTIAIIHGFFVAHFTLLFPKGCHSQSGIKSKTSPSVKLMQFKWKDVQFTYYHRSAPTYSTGPSPISSSIALIPIQINTALHIPIYYTYEHMYQYIYNIYQYTYIPILIYTNTMTNTYNTHTALRITNTQRILLCQPQFSVCLRVTQVQ